MLFFELISAALLTAAYTHVSVPIDQVEVIMRMVVALWLAVVMVKFVGCTPGGEVVAGYDGCRGDASATYIEPAACVIPDGWVGTESPDRGEQVSTVQTRALPPKLVPTHVINPATTCLNFMAEHPSRTLKKAIEAEAAPIASLSAGCRMADLPYELEIQPIWSPGGSHVLFVTLIHKGRTGVGAVICHQATNDAEWRAVVNATVRDLLGVSDPAHYEVRSPLVPFGAECSDGIKRLIIQAQARAY